MTESTQQLIARVMREHRIIETRHRLRQIVRPLSKKGPSKHRIQKRRINGSTWNVRESASLYGFRVGRV